MTSSACRWATCCSRRPPVKRRALPAPPARTPPPSLSFNMPSPTTGSCRSRRRRRRAVVQTSHAPPPRGVVARPPQPTKPKQTRRQLHRRPEVLSGPARLAAPRPGITPRSATRLARRWRRASTIACCVPSPGWEEWSHGHCGRSARQCGGRRPSGRRCRPSSTAGVTWMSGVRSLSSRLAIRFRPPGVVASRRGW